MISVVIKKNNSMITSLKVSGHAGYDDKGKDIVCAGVSSIVIGGFNALAKKSTKVKFLVNDNVSEVKIKDESSEVQVVLETMIIQLKTIHESYSNYIEIKEV